MGLYVMVQTKPSRHMKKPISVKFLFSSAILAWALIGDLLSCKIPMPRRNQPRRQTPISSPLLRTTRSTASTLPPDIDPNSPLAQVIRLVQAGVEQSVILTYISNSTSPFNLNSDEIIYLNDLGVPTEIVNAMMQRDQQLQQMGVDGGRRSHTASGRNNGNPGGAAGRSHSELFL